MNVHTWNSTLLHGRDPVVDPCRDRPEGCRIDRAGLEEGRGRIEEAGAHEVHHYELLGMRPADSLVMDRAANEGLERSAPYRDATTDVEEPKVELAMV